MRRWQIPVVAMAVAFAVFGVNRASSSEVPLAQPPGLKQNSATLTVVSRVRDLFSGTGGTSIQGRTTQYSSYGTNWTAVPGPDWTTLTAGSSSNDWTIAGQKVQRNAGGSSDSVALVPWLTRASRLDVKIFNVSGTTGSGTNTQVGLMMGANATGSAGLAARLWWNGSNAEFSFARQDSATSSSDCTVSPINLTGTPPTPILISMVYEPSSGSAATATISWGSNSITSSCDLGTANGKYAGLISYNASVARYDNFITNINTA
ncbi:MAG: hypothetical protein Q8P61_01905 [Candidatus Nanopelagicales bacterium]|nr:hypothetical protein [Candidatus Nanopelagicales bacterium]